MALSAHVKNTTVKRVDIVYMDREITKYWNAKRRDKATEPAVFTGFYWLHAGDEGGPFKSRSAAVRDAYYRIVLGHEPPALGKQSKRKFQLNGRVKANA